MKRINWPTVSLVGIGAATLIALSWLGVLDRAATTHLLTALAAWITKGPRLTKDEEE